MMERAFAPGSTVSITVSGSSQRVLLPTMRGPFQVRICNQGTDPVWLNFGDVTVTATTAGYPVPGNGFTEVITLNPENSTNYIAAIAGGATGVISFTVGGGI